VTPGHAVPAIAVLGGTGADTRDGDLAVERASGTPRPKGPSTLRQIAHHLAAHGVASLRWDRRGFGTSGGDAATADYATDLEDAVACFAWLREQPAIDGRRVGVAGHSAGALVACRVCRDVPDVAGAALLGALSSSIEDLLRWNVARVRRHWEGFTTDQRAWLIREMPHALVRAEGVDDLLAAARAGQETVRLEGHGVVLEMRTARLRQDLATNYEDELRHVTCPALVLHGGDDLNVRVDDAVRSYQALRRFGNDDVQLTVLPGMEHYFVPVDPDPERRVWERITQATMSRPMAPEALDVLGRWAARTLAATRS
jgi:pimeloyl-ACP methyl ester carboxylesterase